MTPKFRAWDVHNKEMFTNAQLIIWNGNVYANDPDKISAKKLMGWSVDEKYLMQSTGLFDSSKNTREIFQDDIIKRTSLVPGGRDLIGVVKMLEGQWFIDTGSEAVQLWTECDANIVLGNIYENPELVEEINE